MAGHSRWAQVKHKKAGADARRGVLFSKLARMITVAAREGGPEPDANPKLRSVMEQARASGMPKENVRRAISRSSAASVEDGGLLQPVEYEAYGPGASAFLISGLTDNPNRTVSELKRLLAASGGRLAEAGSVNWLFERKIRLEVPTSPDRAADALELELIDAGAEEVGRDDHAVLAFVSPGSRDEFEAQLRSRGLAPARSSLVAVPRQAIELDPGSRARAHSLAEALREHQDITEVWTNVADSG